MGIEGSPFAWAPYCGPGATPADLLSRWNVDPLVLAGLALVALGLWFMGRPRLPGWQGVLGVGVLALVFVSPLCALSSALFAARTVHHIALVAVAAPLLAWALPRAKSPSLATATAASAVVFWLWHAPGVYAWAMTHDAAYWLMQASLLGAALWFWSAVRTASPIAAVASLLASTIQMGLLGALLTFATRSIYAPHFATTQAWGLSALQDQQAAGLIMWAPAAAIYLGSALAILGRWLGPGAPRVQAA